ncbi:cyclic pyranopterin monophosphate synthase MoaC [Frigoribacterium sp. CFBP9039]|uniref:cyclic pyranopterin monophosphate synthase MoaC n=1 Tax=Frigoribacterium sp. CFBP9029 TaxID=3096541 RepID=UPI002A69AF74|nr:cyclic pyranopterin monophosphate synthase MoaC [Frigoribacterium sp. CFBP9039]MDY0944787.1 cyclic pyranopterin monophosphate synthase MoaC [Frigoribacterium sp. CFBP9039]
MTDREPPAGTAPPGLTHVRDDGTAHMVDVTDKSETTRVATAQARLTTRGDVVARLVEGTLPKGEALGTARIAGIMAAKQTSSLIPLCHPLPIGSVTVDFEPGDTDVVVLARVKTHGKTGVEMEALTAASIAALTLYDMIKAVDPLAEIHDVKVLAKQGGKSGDWAR